MVAGKATRMASRILSVALIGKHLQPLHVANFTEDQTRNGDLKWNYVAHTSLDIFEEREVQTTKPTDCYLGLLMVLDDHAVYGYQTNTRLKLVLAVELAETFAKDSEIKQVFKAIHHAYLNYISNPFTPSRSETKMEEPITSKKFLKALDAIAGYERLPPLPSAD